MFNWTLSKVFAFLGLVIASVLTYVMNDGSIFMTSLPSLCALFAVKTWTQQNEK